MVYKKIIIKYGFFPLKTQDITRIYGRQYIFDRGKHLCFRYGQNESGVSRKIGLSVEKTVCSGFRIQKTRLFCPYENLGGGTAPLSPFQRSPHSACGSLPPLLGQDLHSCPATKGAYPLGFPTDLYPLNRPQIRQKRLGFRLRSPLPSGEEPCPLRLQTVFFTHKPSQ